MAMESDVRDLRYGKEDRYQDVRKRGGVFVWPVDQLKVLQRPQEAVRSIQLALPVRTLALQRPRAIAPVESKTSRDAMKPRIRVRSPCTSRWRVSSFAQDQGGTAPS